MRLTCASVMAAAAALLVWAAAASQERADVKANLDLPFDAVGERAQEEEDAPEIVSFYGMTLEGDAFIYILCGRGEMWLVGELEVARREVLRNIREFRPETEFAIVYYDSRGPKLFPAEGRPVKASARTKEAAEAFLDKLAWDGEFTAWMEEPFREAFRLADRTAARRKRIIYVSDGDDEVYKPIAKFVASTPEFAHELVARITAMNVKRVPVDCVDVSEVDSGGPGSAQALFLQDLAAMNGGQYKAAHTPGRSR
ncbi:MAG: hypothetical protein HY721_13295 [Planctomycetes bacterium]|nr:hypothetical protein [Planctomycetota bacterium]